MLKQKLFENAFFKIFIRGFSFIASIIIGRFAGAAVLGNVGLAMSFQNIFNSILTVSLGNAHLKLYNENPAIGHKTFIYLLILLRIVIASCIAFFCGILIITESNMYSNLQINLILLFIFQSIIGATILSNNFIFVSRLEIIKANIPYVIESILISSSKIVAVILGYHEYGIAGMMLVGSIFSIVTPLIQLHHIDVGSFNWEIAKKYIYISGSLLAGALSHALLVNFDKISLAAFISDEKMLGYYTAGDRLGTLFLMIGTSMGGVFLSVFSKNKNKIENSLTVEKYGLAIYQFFLPLIVFFIFYSKNILGLLYGNGFQEAYFVLILTMLHAFVKIQNVPLHNLFISYNKLKQYNILNVLYAMSIIMMIMSMGYFNPFKNYMNSIVFGLFCTALVERFLLLYYLRKDFEKLKFIKNIYLLFFSTAYVLFAIIFVTNNIQSTYLIIFIYYVINTLIYTVLCLSFGIFNLDTFHKLKEKLFS